MKKRNILSTTVLFVLFLLLPARVSAQVKFIDLTNPFLRKIPMAVPVFKAMGDSGDEARLVVEIADQVAAMLEFTGYFALLDRGAFLYDPKKGGITAADLKFANWTAVGAELLITGGVQFQDGALNLEMRLFDTVKASLLIGKRYNGRPDDQRTIVKRFCTEVIHLLTKNRGFFNSRIAFISTGNGHKELYVCEFDGTGVQQITQKKSITTTPDWSSDGRHMAFTSFARGAAQIYVHDLASGIETHFRYRGVQISPRWAPGRFELAATLSFAGDQEIYLLTGGGKMIKRLTQSPGIDVEPSWSPNGKRIAFVSKRAGTPQIYVKDLESGQTYRLTYQGRYNTQPSWSPKGDKIAYSSMENGQLDIYVIDIEGNHPIKLTHNQGDNEAPTWSPDGSLIAFSSTREGGSRIFVMTAFGTDQRRLLVLPGKQSHPRWSPNLTP
ncbi:MAG: Tol-Pal system beta propeller repeat protein TolB [Desulfatitalea sp.]|nr:Tol-Pal system beta propeller repeat protein TolB [Desulfatitalea sp.]NNK01571.1 Tol-Pal system beta propeller repeat protein TolB [Desulfatitalea sp.]